MHPGAATDPSQRTRYAYDDYKRLISVTDPRNKTTRYSYVRWNKPQNSYIHTYSFVFRQTSPSSPSGKIVDHDCDDNFRAFIKREAPSTADDASTWYTYDPVGNLKTVKDPRSKVTTYFYDERNRLTDANDPLPGDRNTNNHTVSWTYDPAGNKLSELRANGQLIRYDSYNKMNRLTQQSVQRGNTTSTKMTYDLAGNLETVEDPKGKVYRTTTTW